ncbi:META domain-containing protein [Lentzea sp. BCCO 10_0798]|uniref:META domain-containing protein n=1 Tax=Lentzea kristufekii TaxID=3095430 RepID=A0ABU4TV04_9PSEU|nr:META domain-containing protein [Lentzea sp. BCCO 10_0798]MDX8051869.1 META domain-containing protein [Lentzea sp. BCCO 10_0798]
MGSRLLVAVVLLATACGSAGGGGNGVQGKVFTSTSVTEQGKPRPLVEGTKVELRFTADGRLLANAGCNQMQGPVKLDDGKLTVTDLSTTDMACPTQGLHEQDEWLSGLLGGKPSWRLDGPNLVLTGANSEIVLAPEPQAPLEGVTWTVDGIITKDVVSSAPEGVTGTISFKNGYIYVQGGCNGGSTEVTGADKYEVDGQRITFGSSLTMTLMMCAEDKMKVESAILDTLGLGEVTFEIDGDTMTLMNANGAGLKLRK